MDQMGSIKAKQRATISESHGTCSKANEHTFKLMHRWVDIQLYCAPRVWTLDFFAIFWETPISFFIQTIDEFDSPFSSSPGFFVADADTINIFEMILDDFEFNRQIGTDFEEDFVRNNLFIDVAMFIMINSMISILLNRRSDFPSLHFTHWGLCGDTKSTLCPYIW